ncbi:MAG: hypothetical protein QM775_13890 [Pirellulales bacterium]
MLVDLVKQSLTSQYEAALATLAHCAACCPDSSWGCSVARYPFNQVIFHTLFFVDFYLGDDEESFRRQPFHLENTELFADYEQLEDREPIATYAKEQIRLYGNYCREKASSVVAQETELTLSAPNRLTRRNFSARNCTSTTSAIFNITRRNSSCACGWIRPSIFRGSEAVGVTRPPKRKRCSVTFVCCRQRRLSEIGLLFRHAAPPLGFYPAK